MDPYAHQLMNQAFLRNAQMNGGDCGGDYLDIDYGGARDKSDYNKFQTSVAKKAHTLGIKIHPGTAKYSKMWCEFVRKMGYASKVCKATKGRKLTSATRSQIIDMLIRKHYGVGDSDDSSDFLFPSLNQDLNEIIEDTEDILIEPNINAPSSLQKCNRKLADIKRVLGMGYGYGILAGGAAKKKKRVTKSGSKTAKKKSTSRKGNPWSKFITLWAKKHGKTLTQAMKSAQAKKEYCTWIGKSRKSIGVQAKCSTRKKGMTKKPTSKQSAARKKLEKCAVNKRTLAALKKCRAAGILI